VPIHGASLDVAADIVGQAFFADFGLAGIPLLFVQDGLIGNRVDIAVDIGDKDGPLVQNIARIRLWIVEHFIFRCALFRLGRTDKDGGRNQSRLQIPSAEIRVIEGGSTRKSRVIRSLSGAEIVSQLPYLYNFCSFADFLRG